MLKFISFVSLILLSSSCVNNPNQPIGQSYVRKQNKEISDGYSSQSSAGYTGSADQVKDLGNNITLENYLRRVSGVSVKGDGASARITIRGVNTFSPTGTEPLFVLNNTVMNGTFSDIYQMVNPSDISSVSVLKDASSTGIYGSRGANGVIVINLKKK